MPSAFGKINVSSKAYYQPVAANDAFGRSLRLSEAFLNFCEAKAMLYKAGVANAGQEALNTLNEFRRFRFPLNYQNENITDPEKLITFIHNERREEL